MTAKAKVTTVAKPATAAKPAAKKTTAAAAKTSSKAAKTTTAKHTATAKKTATKKTATVAKKSLAIGDALPVCAFEAVAMSLRLAGQRVHDDDVAELWRLTGADPDGASAGDALAAAVRFGLADVRPVITGYNAACCPEHSFYTPAGYLILGITHPFPHAVLATPDGWWSWGSLHSPWPAVIDEAWAVSWS